MQRSENKCPRWGAGQEDCPRIGETWEALFRGDDLVTFRVEFVSTDERVFEGPVQSGKHYGVKKVFGAGALTRRVK